MKAGLVDFLRFRSFVTHNIVKVLFWILSGLMLISYPVAILAAIAQEGVFAGIAVMLGGALGLVFVTLILRVYAELVIVVFGIHDELKQMNDRASVPR